VLNFGRGRTKKLARHGQDGSGAPETADQSGPAAGANGSGWPAASSGDQAENYDKCLEMPAFSPCF